MKKRGQFQLSFGMIFSIILIIAFLAFAFYAIRAFLDFRDDTLIVDFKNDLQRNVDEAWRGNMYDKGHEYILPSKVERVCFTDRLHLATDLGEDERYFTDDGNLYFYPLDKNAEFQGGKIDNIDIAGTIESSESNMKCFENENGKVKMKITKEYGANWVILKNE